MLSYASVSLGNLKFLTLTNPGHYLCVFNWALSLSQKKHSGVSDVPMCDNTTLCNFMLGQTIKKTPSVYTHLSCVVSHAEPATTRAELRGKVVCDLIWPSASSHFKKLVWRSMHLNNNLRIQQSHRGKVTLSPLEILVLAWDCGKKNIFTIRIPSGHPIETALTHAVVWKWIFIFPE